MSNFAKDKDVLISRQAAIEAIVNTVSEIGLHDNSEVARYGATFRQHEIIDIIEALPSAEPRWIPCSEKLPERGVSVLLSHVGYVSEDYLDIDDGAMYFWNSGIDLDEELNNLAWLPLPEPWKGETDE